MCEKEPIFKKPFDYIFLIENFYQFYFFIGETRKINDLCLQIGFKCLNKLFLTFVTKN